MKPKAWTAASDTETVPHVTLKSIANNEPPEQETLYDQPLVDKSKARVTGPVHGRSRPCADGEIPGGDFRRRNRRADARRRFRFPLRRNRPARRLAGELLRAGIRGKGGQMIRFSRVEPLSGTRWLHADAETKPNDDGADKLREGAANEPQRVVISFGPEHAPLEQKQVEMALEEARKLVPRPQLIVFAAFQFDPEAAKDIDELNWPGVTTLKAQMNADLLTEDLKKKRTSNESFWLIGQPDVMLRKSNDAERRPRHLGSGSARLRLLQHEDRPNRVGRRGANRHLDARHGLRRAKSVRAAGFLPDGRGERGLGEAGEEPQGGD